MPPKLERIVSDLAESVAAFIQSQAELTESVKDLKESVKGLKESVEVTNASVLLLSATVTELKSDMASVKDELAGLKQQMTGFVDRRKDQPAAAPVLSKAALSKSISSTIKEDSERSGKVHNLVFGGIPEPINAVDNTSDSNPLNYSVPDKNPDLITVRKIVSARGGDPDHVTAVFRMGKPKSSYAGVASSTQRSTQKPRLLKVRCSSQSVKQLLFSKVGRDTAVQTIQTHLKLNSIPNLLMRHDLTSLQREYNQNAINVSRHIMSADSNMSLRVRFMSSLDDPIIFRATDSGLNYFGDPSDQQLLSHFNYIPPPVKPRYNNK